MKDSALYYSVGALLYCPANNETISDSIIHNKFAKPFSLALCLEDTIPDNFVLQAEELCYHSLLKIEQANESQEFYLPKIFIRVRNPEQMLRLYHRFERLINLICGFIVPKFDLDNADAYIHNLCEINSASKQPVYMMPIYESSSIIDLRTRYDILYTLKDKIDSIEKLILNIRVGGNDLCHVFGYRRHVNESIHQIKPIADIFSDINTIYGRDYVISGAVWEYFDGAYWEEGLKKEIMDDKLCGFIGKTVIHPKQIPIINSEYAVHITDYQSAKAILNWDNNSKTLVSSDPQKVRMNEYKTHANWAKKIMLMAKHYGITRND